ncbi:MAG: AbrB/MazE/SpoVT family DNA-binding domain-containing protein [Clostridia bacterium]|nr:AbrB/MazE/SpoVT family DNA-binding domain-containing protein [Clostridia bacterium]
MKSLGIVRRIDNLGRIVLPIELRHVMDIKDGDALEFFTEENRIVLKKYQPACIYCGDARDVISFRGHNICQNCIAALKEL